jgi:transcriptional regulator with GAF, ATPase, and Fis domain
VPQSLSDAARPATMVCESSSMRALLISAARVARSDAKVLITGESGVGKDLIARLIHRLSPRAERRFVALNCAGLPEDLLESELFGHVRGSFTGAYRDNPGKLQLAHRGTLFLDEIGDMSLRMQAVLLRFLESGEIQTVGTDVLGATVDVRVIAATHRDLRQRVREGQFREDLLYRLRVIHIQTPPLRERTDDIAPLVHHFLLKFPLRVVFTDAAFALLRRHHWPGNVRELQNVVEQAVWGSDGAVVDVAHVVPCLEPSTVTGFAGERRRQVADELYEALVSGGYSFWDHIHPLFLARELTRHDVRELLHRGLTVTAGNYRALLRLFGMPHEDYKRLLNFLAAHQCTMDVRAYRRGTPLPTQSQILALPPLALPPSPRSETE